ncbi:MAG: phosphoribosylformylglycinamidine cyclo-ligase [Deltaproteobacteria bacterium]|nr:phosphoribosylformylglycinamidine cyclo-ligase [Deltaproteobacteria bacterium]
MSAREKLNYKNAGVDIDAGNRFVQMIKPLVKTTFRPEVHADIGGFGGLFSLNSGKYEKPVLVSSTDGVGTKLKIAFLMDKHDTIGIDLVAMCVNDIIVQGAEPLFFLDYLATGKLSPEKSYEIVKGIAEGCKEAGCALIGGETAELPDMYAEGEYDLAGFSVGVVDSNKIVDGSSVRVGDTVIGLASSGLHSNGYSLARKVLLEKMALSLEAVPADLGRSLGDELLMPTRIYIRTVLNLLRDFDVKGMAHITGGGLLENIPRILPKNCLVHLDKSSWEIPPIFELIRQGGNVDENEMFRTFNCGIGMILIVPQEETDDILGRLKGLDETASLIGEVRAAKGSKKQVILD